MVREEVARGQAGQAVRILRGESFLTSSSLCHAACKREIGQFRAPPPPSTRRLTRIKNAHNFRDGVALVHARELDRCGNEEVRPQPAREVSSLRCDAFGHAMAHRI